MSMRSITIALLSFALISCGGGGGNPGTISGSGAGTGSGSGTSSNGNSQTTKTASMTIDVLGSTNSSTTAISSVEISQVKIVLKDKEGKVVPGVVVTFGETGPNLLTFAPVAKTALTDSNGVASVEARATLSSSTGATTVTASATVAGESVTVSRALAITSAPQTPGVVVDPQSLVNSISFVDSNPADKSIVLAGSGGNSRAESATLRFRVVDKNNSAVKGVVVNFRLRNSNAVTLNIATANSDSDGIVVTSVSSGSVPTSVVVEASVTKSTGAVIVSQSDSLTVTTGVATQAGFDLSAGRYSLNSRLSGDKTKITVRIVDANGNPVADGVPVVFTSPFGAVGTSSRGGCVTSNGACDVDYSVQDPRPADGVLAVVTASTQVGNGLTISNSLSFNFSRADFLDMYDTELSSSPVTALTMPTTSCKFAFPLFVGTPAGLSAPKGTSLTGEPITSDMKVLVKTGSPTPDSLSRTRFSLEVDLTALTSNFCVAGGAKTYTAQAQVKIVSLPVEVVRAFTITYVGP